MKISFNKEWIFRCEEDTTPVFVTLPHDAMQTAGRSADSPGGSSMAYYIGGKYIYEKQFEAPAEWENQCITLEFESVYKNAQVFINGKLAGGRPYGYIPFFVSLDGLLQYGKSNTIKVIADTTQLPCSRWYSGAGIYRPVWLHIKPKNHIEVEGVRITTLSYAPARIRVETAHSDGDVQINLLDNGVVVASGSGDCVEIDIPDARLWSGEEPNLYTCQVNLKDNDTVVDTEDILFGVRFIEWNPKGLFINGKETLLRGGCIHHDNGILGACSFPESEERRIRILKEAGFNAVRSSHNPAAKSMLEACDKLGMYVMDETWDMWYTKKKDYDYAADFMDNFKEDIRTLVKRNYNHPSVIMYSLGNEVTEPKEEKGVELLKSMVEIVHESDNSRPVTCGINITLMLISLAEGAAEQKESEKANPFEGKEGSERFNAMTATMGTRLTQAANSESADQISTPSFDTLDIAGYNYASGRYAMDGELHPSRIIVGSETFPQDIYKNWELVKQYPYVIGDFIWTAWDYLGEAGIGAWAYTPDGTTFDKPYPWLLADAGAIDILGNPGAQAGYNAVVWGVRQEPYIGVQPVNHPDTPPAKAIWRGTNALPSWSWAGCDGNEAVVEVYTQGDTAELFLNDISAGRQKLDECKATFKLAYAPGILEAVVYDEKDIEIGRTRLISAGKELNIGLQSESLFASADGIIYVDVAISDENGTVESNTDLLLKANVEGGELLGFGSANPRTEERYTDGTFTSYYGRAQAVIRAQSESNSIRFTVSSDKFQTAELVIPVK